MINGLGPQWAPLFPTRHMLHTNLRSRGLKYVSEFEQWKPEPTEHIFKMWRVEGLEHFHMLERRT